MIDNIRVGFVILAHSAPERVRQVARHLVDQGGTVHIHFDTKLGAPDRWDLKEVTFSSEISADWGGFGLVEATIRSVKRLLLDNSNLTHIALLSEACLPLRPLDQLRVHLHKNSDTDFITVRDLEGDDWVGDGLSKERVALKHPFSYRNQRRLFDLNVKLQRSFGLNRKLPAGLKPKVGDQWWCLRTETLRAVLAHPSFEDFKKFMQTAWIPDEIFFQTLISDLGRKTEKSLTYAEFDRIGKPYVFYDDHTDLLGTLPGFFVRKIWRGADQVYNRYLCSPVQKTTNPALSMRTRSQAPKRHRVNMGHAIDVRSRMYEISDRPFTVFFGFGTAQNGFASYLRDNVTSEVLEGVFSRKLRRDLRLVSGNVSIDPRILRHNPHAQMGNILNAHKGANPIFLMETGDHHGLWTTVLRSSTARVIFLEDHWKCRLTPSSNKLRRQRLQNVHDALLNPILFKNLKADFKKVSLACFLSDPMTALEAAGLQFAHGHNGLQKAVQG